MNSKLHVYVTRIVTSGAVFFAIVASTVFYFYNRAAQLSDMEKAIEQLFVTVKIPAEISAYLDNDELAREVIDGLQKNDVVSAAILTSRTGMEVASASAVSLDTSDSLFFSLYNPFEASDWVGVLQIQLNKALLYQSVMNSALEQMLILLVLIIIVATLVLVMMRRVLTTPIQSIADNLHKITPGEEGQLSCPKGHENNDIGNLVADINKLLMSTHDTIVQERQLRSQVETMEKHFRLIFERASAGIFLLDWNLHLRSSNKAFQKIIGIAEIERRLDKKNIYLPELFTNPCQVHELLDDILETHKSVACDLQLETTCNGEERWLHCLFSAVHNDQSKNEADTLIEGLVIDVTERTFQMERVLYESEHDPLTQLFNRRAGNQLLDIMLVNAKKNSEQLVLLLIDLDGFKEVNDNFGHKVGDKVLIEVASRLKATVRKEDILIRLGGDEFVIAFNVTGEGRSEIDHFVENLLNRFKTDIQLKDNNSITIGSSIGIAVYPHDGETIGTLMANADSAMYLAKKEGKNRAYYYCVA
ncbi:MAG: diguanylate cyclase [Nitrosomonas sp.]|nr:diguanylate cyclase [Nitrosomonas sp.]MCW5607497.1 diguanylate cyclase [Nitrosomonas sp.]